MNMPAAYMNQSVIKTPVFTEVNQLYRKEYVRWWHDAMAKKEVRDLFSRRIAPEDKGYFHRLNYNALSSVYSQGIPAHRLGGSSINRRIRDTDRHRYRVDNEGFYKVSGRVGNNVREDAEYREFIRSQIEKIESDRLARLAAIAEKNKKEQEEYKLQKKQIRQDIATELNTALSNARQEYKAIQEADKMNRTRFARVTELRKKIKLIRSHFKTELKARILAARTARPKNKIIVHQFSNRTKSKVRLKLTAFHRSCPAKSRIFSTLTFIDQVTDKQGVKILNKFFTVLRKEKPDIEHLWVCERQLQKTGNIHFHIVLNYFVEIKRFNALWVLQQYNSGLRFRDISIEEIQERYNNTIAGKKKGEFVIEDILNPVDVEPIKDPSHLAHYLTKYITKNNDQMQCANWHCSRRVSKLFTCALVETDMVALAMSTDNARVDFKTGEFLSMPRPFIDSFYTIHPINNKAFFLPRLKEMEFVNRYIMNAGGCVAWDVEQYIRGNEKAPRLVDDDKYQDILQGVDFKLKTLDEQKAELKFWNDETEKIRAGGNSFYSTAN